MEFSSQVSLFNQAPSNSQPSNSYGKICYLALGLIFIAAGTVAAGVLHSRLGHLSLSCLGVVPVGIIFVALGLKAQKPSLPLPRPNSEIQQIPTFGEKLSDIPFVSQIPAAMHLINRKGGQGVERAIVIGNIKPDQKFGPESGAIIIKFLDNHSFESVSITKISLNGWFTSKAMSKRCELILEVEGSGIKNRELKYYVFGAPEETDEFGQKYLLADPSFSNN